MRKQKLLLMPQHADDQQGRQHQGPKEQSRHPSLLPERGINLIQIHLGDHEPGRVRDFPRHGQNLDAAIIHAFDHTSLAFDSQRLGKIGPVHEQPELQGGLRAVPHIIQVKHIPAFTPDQQRLRRATGGGPALHQRIKKTERVHIKQQHAVRQRIRLQFRSNRNQDIQMNPLIGGVAMQIRDDHFPGAQRGLDILSTEEYLLSRIGRGRQPDHSSRVKQSRPAVAARRPVGIHQLD